MPIKLIHHVDLAVSTSSAPWPFTSPCSARSAWRRTAAIPSYRGSEEVVYLRAGEQLLGFRQADGGEHRYYEVGLEHLALVVDTAKRSRTPTLAA